MEQLDLFSEDGKLKIGFEEAKAAQSTLPKKRIHYSKPTYNKDYENFQDIKGNVFDDKATWGRMSQIYSILGNNHFAILFSTDDIKNYGIVRCYTRRYFAEKYEYKDLMNPKSKWETYIGQDFEEKQAEIIGSELLGIEERLFLHESLLEYLEEGYQIESLTAG